MIAGLHCFPIAVLKRRVELNDELLVVIHDLSVDGTFFPSAMEVF